MVPDSIVDPQAQEPAEQQVKSADTMYHATTDPTSDFINTLLESLRALRQ